MRQVMYLKARDMLRRGQTTKEWFVRHCSGKMVHTDADRRENQTIRRTCPG